jgi:hypothetical protein
MVVLVEVVVGEVVVAVGKKDGGRVVAFVVLVVVAWEGGSYLKSRGLAVAPRQAASNGIVVAASGDSDRSWRFGGKN